jgi:hypothetical protein
VCSIVRLTTLKDFGLTADPTWDNVPTTFWTTLETTTAMICTCLPALRAGLLRIFPSIFGSSKAQSTGASHNKGSRTYQESSSFSAIKPWPAQRLPSVSSVNLTDEESQSIRNHSQATAIIELQAIGPDTHMKDAQ